MDIWNPCRSCSQNIPLRFMCVHFMSVCGLEEKRKPGCRERNKDGEVFEHESLQVEGVLQLPVFTWSRPKPVLEPLPFSLLLRPRLPFVDKVRSDEEPRQQARAHTKEQSGRPRWRVTLWRDVSSLLWIGICVDWNEMEVNCGIYQDWLITRSVYTHMWTKSSLPSWIYISSIFCYFTHCSSFSLILPGVGFIMLPQYSCAGKIRPLTLPQLEKQFPEGFTL